MWAEILNQQNYGSTLQSTRSITILFLLFEFSNFLSLSFSQDKNFIVEETVILETC